jgi:hypothetical protein
MKKIIKIIYFLLLIVIINKLKKMKKQMALEELIKARKITNITIDRVEIAKSYIEKKYSLRKQQIEEKQKGKFK